MSLPHPLDEPEFYDHLMIKRFMAWVIDLVITLVMVLVALVLTGFLAIFILPFVWAAIAIAYRTVMLTRYGATLGMMVASVRWVRLDATRPDQTLALWHSVIYAGSMSFVIPQIASVAMMMITPYRQGLNDWILGTTIVNRYIEH
ncbi:RDD family protein [Pararhodobacter marinus]|uniref:RDD family protein n=1 Tax=Pararhodobacter marinus TaxID=2184063 RepID=UPI003512CDAE